jgi:hypothetical protein
MGLRVWPYRGDGGFELFVCHLAQQPGLHNEVVCSGRAFSLNEEELGDRLFRGARPGVCIAPFDNFSVQ